MQPIKLNATCVICFSLLMTIMPWIVQCNHMLGATASWKVTETDSSGNLKVQCSAQVFLKGGFSWPGTYTSVDTTLNETINFLDSNEVDLSVSDDWYISQSFQTLFKKDVYAEEFYQESCCWATNIYGYKGAWSFSFFIDLTVREDTGRPNSSPVALQLPLVRMYVGCPDSFVIPTMDEDGDVVTCRFGNTWLEEGSIKNTYTYISLEEQRCRLLYNGGGYKETVPVAIIVEDHEVEQNSGDVYFGKYKDQVFSYVPLQFVVQIDFSPVTYCPPRPQIIPPTPKEGAVILISYLDILSIYVAARPPAGYKIAGFNVMGIAGVNKSSINALSNGDYEAKITFGALLEYRGHYLICVTAEDDTGTSSQPTCFKLLVENDAPSCGADNAGCSDTCVLGTDLHSSLSCSCGRSCWELSDDQRTCIPKVRMSCESSIDISVEKCAADGVVGIGGYADNQPSDIPPACRPADAGDLIEFSFQADECNTIKNENDVEIRYENTVQVWVVDPKVDVPPNNLTVTQGLWYNVPVACRIPKYVYVNGSFHPEDNIVEIGTIEGMGDYTITFDFYKDDTFKTTYSPYDYPIIYNMDSELFFGITAEVKPNSDDLELFTISCIAYPDPNPGNIAPFYMITDGCPMYSDILKFDSEDAMKNLYQTDAFRFKYGLDGINSNTNVLIQCKVMICVKDESDNCAALICNEDRNRISRQHLQKYRNQHYEVRLSNYVENDEIVDPTRNPNVTESDVIDLPMSFGVRIADDESPDNNNNDNGSTPVGIIVGAVIGSIVALLLVALIGMYAYSISQKNKIIPDPTPSAQPNLNISTEESTTGGSTSNC